MISNNLTIGAFMRDLRNNGYKGSSAVKAVQWRARSDICMKQLGSAEKWADRTEGVEVPCWQVAMTSHTGSMARKSNEVRRDTSASEFIGLFYGEPLVEYSKKREESNAEDELVGADGCSRFCARVWQGARGKR